MTLRRLSILQWFGLLVGAPALMVQLVGGYAYSEAACGPGGPPWGIGNDTWQATTMIATGFVVLAAGLAAVTVVRHTRHVTYESGPPLGRIRFLAIAAIPANACFLAIVLLSGTASLADVVCRQG